MTWNVVWWDTQFNKGDVVIFRYANPIIPGQEVYEFSTTAPSAFTILKGDVNDDGDVNIADVVTNINYLLQISEFVSDAQLYAADFNFDFALNISDVVGMINHILNVPTLMLSSSSNNSIANVSLPSKIKFEQDMLEIPIEIIFNERVAALQYELEYDHANIIAKKNLILEGDEWDGINVLNHSPEPGRVIYLFYSLDGKMMHIDNLPALNFSVISEDKQMLTEVKLVESVISNRSGKSVEISYGNSISKIDIIPKTFVMYPNYPNPFNPITNIRYDIPKSSNVKIDIFNILGHKVKSLVNTTKMAGNHNVQWSGKMNRIKNLPSGLYIVRFNAGDIQSAKNYAIEITLNDDEKMNLKIRKNKLKVSSFFNQSFFFFALLLGAVYSQNNVLYIQDGFGSASLEENSISVILANEDTIAGFQFDIQYDPQDINLQNVQLTNTTEGMDLFFNESQPGQVTIIVTSFSGEVIYPSYSKVIDIDFNFSQTEQLEASYIELSNIALSKVSGMTAEVSSADGYLVPEGVDFMKAHNGISSTSVSLFNSFDVAGMQITLSFDPSLVVFRKYHT